MDHCCSGNESFISRTRPNDKTPVLQVAPLSFLTVCVDSAFARGTPDGMGGHDPSLR